MSASPTSVEASCEQAEVKSVDQGATYCYERQGILPGFKPAQSQENEAHLPIGVPCRYHERDTHEGENTVGKRTTRWRPLCEDCLK